MNIENYQNVIDKKKYKNINFISNYSSINRYNKYYLTKHIELSNKIVTIFKIETSQNVVNYAYLYTDNNLKHKYININNTIRSKDGIYSYGFIKYKYIKDIKNLSKVIKFIKDNIGIVKFSCYTFNSSKKNIIQIESSITNKLYYKLLAISFIDTLNSIDESRIFSKNILTKFKELNSDKYDIDRLVYYSDFKNNINIILGQKILPESLYAFNYDNYKIVDYTQEISIMMRLNKLIFNLTTPCFAMLVNSFKFRGIDTKLYDNEDIVNKINISKYISKKDSLVDNSTNMLFLLIEHCGHTLFNHIINKDFDYVGDIIGDYNCLKNILFQIIYTLTIINEINIIHNDFHLNNITIHIKNKQVSKKVYSLYTIGNKTYKVPFNGVYPVIIDFGRSIQKEGLNINDYKFLFSKISSKKLLTTSKQKLFNAYSAVDIFKLSTSLKILLDKLSLDKNYNVNKDCIKLLDDISSMAYKHLNSVYTNREFKKNINLTIIEELFSDMLYSDEEINVVDIFSINNIT